jgi:hypothetical protein
VRSYPKKKVKQKQGGGNVTQMVECLTIQGVEFKPQYHHHHHTLLKKEKLLDNIVIEYTLESR